MARRDCGDVCTLDESQWDVKLSYTPMVHVGGMELFSVGGSFSREKGRSAILTRGVFGVQRCPIAALYITFGRRSQRQRQLDH